jgi:hypothetical protein
MDEPWAIEQLENFCHLTELVAPPPMPAGVVIAGDRRPTRAKNADILPAAQVVEKVLDRVLPAWRADVAVDKSGRWQQHRTASIRAIAELKTRAEVAARLGDDAPSLSASSMHPWAWESARSLWQSGHYREAVRAAAVKVNAETQNKVGRRDLSEASLFQNAFSNDPPSSGAPRLRPAGDDGGKTALSVRRGVTALAEGAYGALRNPIGHDEGELGEQDALEQLAVFSVLARAVDASAVER